MQTWHCIALIILSVGIFFYASYLGDVEKSTILSLDDLAEFEKGLSNTKKTDDINDSVFVDFEQQSAWVEQTLVLTSSDSYALSYHASVIEGDFFLQVLVSKLNENPNAKSMILGAFNNNLFSNSDKEILKSLIYTKREPPNKLLILCRGHSLRTASLLAELILREYKKATALEKKDSPLLPSLEKLLQKVAKLQEQAADIKVYLSSMLEENPNDSIEAMALRSEIMQLEQEVKVLKDTLISIDSMNEVSKNPNDFLSVKAIIEFGKVKEYSHFITKLERLSQDDSLNNETKNEVLKNLSLTRENLQKEIIAAINSLKDKVSSILEEKALLQQKLTDHLVHKKTTLSQDPHVKKLNHIRDDLAATQKLYEEELLRWINCKNSFEIHQLN
jgi:regulator of replication initiation timing